MAVWAYSVELRERAVRAFEIGDLTDHEAAELFGVGEATIHRWKRLHRETGTLEPKKHRSGNPPRIKPEEWDLIREIVKGEPDLTIQEIADEFWRRADRWVSRSGMCRTLKKLGLTRKKSR